MRIGGKKIRTPCRKNIQVQKQRGRNETTMVKDQKVAQWLEPSKYPSAQGTWAVFNQSAQGTWAIFNQ